MIRLFTGLVILLYSCQMDRNNIIPINFLENKFQKAVVSKDKVTCTEEFADHTKDANEYIICYDLNGRIVNKANSEFYEYDKEGRIKKLYICSTDRDPECKHPWIFDYIYEKNNLIRINRTVTLDHKEQTTIYETFSFDNLNRLIMHTKAENDTTIYIYAGNDTMKSKSVCSFWLIDLEGKWIKNTRKTNYTHDATGRIISTMWTEGDNSMQNEFIYDSNGRITCEKDSSLSTYNREPNSCCVLYWTNYRYDSLGNVLKEVHTSASNDNPNPVFQWKRSFEYRKISSGDK
jgi:hypothetical protein